MATKWNGGEVVVELAGRKGEREGLPGRTEAYGPVNPYFHLKTFGTSFRGRFSVSAMRGMTSQALSGLPDIPGIFIAVDTKRRRIRAIDPLGLPEYRTVLDQANELCSQTPIGAGMPHPTSVIKGATPTELKTALWEVSQLLDKGKARLVHGEAPTPKEVLAMDGDLKVRTYSEALRTDGQGKPVQELTASEEELTRLGQPSKARVQREPAGTV